MTFESFKGPHTCIYQTFESVKDRFTYIKSKQTTKKLAELEFESFKVLTCREVRVIREEIQENPV